MEMNNKTLNNTAKSKVNVMRGRNVDCISLNNNIKRQNKTFKLTIIYLQGIADGQLQVDYLINISLLSFYVISHFNIINLL